MEFATAAKGAEDIYNGVDSKAARKALPSKLHDAPTRKLDVLDAAESLVDLQGTGLGFHALEADRAGQHAIKINDQYRICFRWTEDGPTDVEIVDYH